MGSQLDVGFAEHLLNRSFSLQLTGSKIFFVPNTEPSIAHECILNDLMSVQINCNTTDNFGDITSLQLFCQPLLI